MPAVLVTDRWQKIANNMLLGISMIATCEAFSLAEKLGLDAQTFFDISSNASGQNWSMTSYCPAPGPVPNAPSNNDYAPGFAVDMMLKDLRLASAASEAVGAETQFGDLAAKTYDALSSDGHGGMDFFRHYENAYKVSWTSRGSLPQRPQICARNGNPRKRCEPSASIDDGMCVVVNLAQPELK